MRSFAVAVMWVLLSCSPEPDLAAVAEAEPRPPELGAPPTTTEPGDDEPAEEDPEPAIPEGPRVVRLSFAGDLVLNPHAAAAVEDDGDDGYANLIAGYARALRDDEIAVVNLEQPLVNDVVPLDPGWPRQDPSRPRRSPILGATPPLADALAAAGVDVATVANNHAYDQQRLGLQRTVEELERVEITAVGAASDSDGAYEGVVIEREGVRVGFLSFSDFFNQPPDGEGTFVAARINDERRDDAVRSLAERTDVLIVAVHWSRDFVTSVRRSERALAEQLIALGADVIVGTGPHVLHEVERVPSPRGEAVVAYSLGNLVSGMGRSYRIGHPPQHFVHPANVTPEARDGVVLHVELEVEHGVRARAREATPLWTENNYLAHRRDESPHRVRVVPLSEASEDVQQERGPIIEAALGSAVSTPDPR